MAIPHLRSLAMFGLAAACAVAGAGAWGLLFAPKAPAKSAEPHDGVHAATPVAGKADPAPSGPPSIALEQSSGSGAVASEDEHDVTHAPASEPPAASSSSGKPRPLPQSAPRLTEKAEKRRTADILRADEQFREGRIAAAMKLYGAAIEAHPRVLDPMVQFRWALCAESLGMLDEAAERYQMLADASPAQAWKGFARWGLSRVLFEQQKLELAQRVTTELWLNQETSCRLWRSELLHWHAHVLYRRVAGEPSARLLDDKSLTGCRIVFRPNRLLEIAARIYASETAAPFDLPPDAALPMTTGKSPDAMYAQYRSGGATVYDAVNQFAQAAQWTVHWSTAAEQVARGHRCRASVSRASVACLLDTLCCEPRLIWAWENQVLRISESAERNAADWKEHQFQIASRSAKEAIELYRDAEWSPYSRLAIAHLEWLGGRQVACRKSLEDLTDSSPKGDLQAEAWFNLGKVHLFENSVDKGIVAFQRAIDHAMGGSLEPIANLYLGRLLLESNEPKRAVVPLRRSLALAAPRDRGTAALTLGVAYILSGQPQNTAEILRSNQNWLDVEQTRDAAAFTSCLAQVLGGHDPTRLKYDLRSLMTSISHVRSDQFFGRAGSVLIAMAYRELGLNGEAAEICRDAIAQMPPCALRMKLELMLVDELVDRRDFEAAEAGLRLICESPNEEVRLLACKRLCDFLLAVDRRDDAEAEALAWLKGCSTPDQQAAALHSLGRCLQRKGDYLNAALCFSGSMPPGVSAGTPVTRNSVQP